MSTGSQSSGEFQAEFTRVMKSLQSDIRFTMEDTFLQDLPVCVPEGRTKELIDRCIQHHGVSRQHIGMTYIFRLGTTKRYYRLVI